MNYNKNVAFDVKPKGQKFSRRGRFLIASLGMSLIITGFSINPDSAIATSTGAPQDKPLHAPVERVAIALPAEPLPKSAQPLLPEPDPEPDQIEEAVQPAPAIEINWTKTRVRAGDSLSRIFKREKLSAATLHQIMSTGQPVAALKTIRPGQTLEFGRNNEDELIALRYFPSRTQTLNISLQENGWQAERETATIEKRVTNASAVISESLFLSGAKAGLSDNLIMQMAGLFGWDIDFALDIRKGDRFSVIYEENYLDGEKISDGNILAAEFVNQGKRFQAVRFTDDSGDAEYFSPDGRSMRKAFLRSPVDFRRISSKFQRERYHPVLGKKRPHRGVDYAAATGTPIKAAGDGKVVFRGTKGGYGRTVILQHGGKYTTLYAHLSKYRKGVGKGSRVKQGQIIGYVGKSGMATGPHLHYEMRINGVHRNPLTVKLPEARPIEKRYQQAFEQQAAPLLAQLQVLDSIQVADSGKELLSSAQSNVNN